MQLTMNRCVQTADYLKDTLALDCLTLEIARVLPDLAAAQGAACRLAEVRYV